MSRSRRSYPPGPRSRRGIPLRIVAGRPGSYSEAFWRSKGFWRRAYWIYWCALTMAIAIEFCILLWAPEFLQQVVGLPATSAAAAAAVFGLAMLTGRAAGGSLLRVIAAQRLFPLGLLVTSLGFLIYWGLPRPPVAIVGLFVLGLGVALLYPLTLALAMGAAGTRADTASARAALAGTLGILVTPALLGGLADKVGLSLAHLIVPGLVVVALICFVTAQALQRRRMLTA